VEKKVPGISLLAAMLLMTMSPPLAFVALRNLLEGGVLRAFYSGLADESEAYFRVSSMVVVQRVVVKLTRK
jgi:hypothetical protein